MPLLDYRQVSTLTVGHFIAHVGGLQRPALGDVRFRELTVAGTAPRGIYLLYHPTSHALSYVGKAGSWNIVGRLGSHLDSRPTAFLNSFVRKLAYGQRAPAALEAALNSALDYTLVALHFDEGSCHMIARIEAALRAVGTPSLNTLTVTLHQFQVLSNTQLNQL